jgi:hypothetical protein
MRVLTVPELVKHQVSSIRPSSLTRDLEIPCTFSTPLDTAVPHKIDGGLIISWEVRFTYIVPDIYNNGS